MLGKEGGVKYVTHSLTVLQIPQNMGMGHLRLKNNELEGISHHTALGTLELA